MERSILTGFSLSKISTMATAALRKTALASSCASFRKSALLAFGKHGYHRPSVSRQDAANARHLLAGANAVAQRRSAETAPFQRGRTTKASVQVDEAMSHLQTSMDEPDDDPESFWTSIEQQTVAARLFR